MEKAVDLIELKPPQAKWIMIEFDELKEKSNSPCMRQNG